ncbi:hypothetical protein VB002_15025 [Campylobacter concisus]
MKFIRVMKFRVSCVDVAASIARLLSCESEIFVEKLSNLQGWRCDHKNLW